MLRSWLTMWIWNRTPIREGFPKGFSVQRVSSTPAKAIADLAPTEIARYFREHPETATALLDESYDKRFSPSSFLMEEGSGFKVGWFTRKAELECVREFNNLADAATDYLLFSLGKGRWAPPAEG